MRWRVDDQAFEHEARLAQRTARRDERLGDRNPFELPGAGGALVVGGHGIEHQAGVLAHDLGSRQDQLARDRVALLRHGRG